MRFSLFSLTLLFIFSALIGVQGCDQEELTRAEAQEALDEVTLSTQAQALTYDSIDISTQFTIGGAVENAAQEIRDFMMSQASCNTVTVESGTVTIDYGTLNDDCLYKGRTYAGVHTITVVKTDMAELQVNHTWTDFTNGIVTVSGTATVTWAGTELTRQVEHELNWQRTGDAGTSFTGRGDRTQRLLDTQQGISAGIQIDGSRDWTTSRGQWTLNIDGIQVRPQDAVPQSGTYTLTNPDGKTLTLSFSRVDDTTIEVQVAGTRRDFTFNVTNIR